MRYTNNYGIKSKSTIDALTTNDYDLQDKPKNVYSLTEIIDAPKPRILFDRHKDEIVMDVSDNFHTLDGSAIHYVIEKANSKSTAERLSEERLYIQVGGNWNVHTAPQGVDIRKLEWYDSKKIYVSCKFDNYEMNEELCEDYKRTSVWESIFGLKDARTKQLNVCGFALRKLGFPCSKLRACLHLKDWSSSELKDAERRAEQNGMPCNYPPIMYKEFDVLVWPDDACEQYITERVLVHEEARASLEDDSIPECDQENRWYRAGKYAVQKKGSARALRVFEETPEGHEQAKAMLASYQTKDPKKAGDYEIEHRPGNDNRCNGDKVYCHARQWCHYWKAKYGRQFVGVDSEY